METVFIIFFSALVFIIIVRCILKAIENRLFNYSEDALTRHCKRCKSMQRKYSDKINGVFTSWWGEYKQPCESRPDCKCHRYAEEN